MLSCRDSGPAGVELGLGRFFEVVQGGQDLRKPPTQFPKYATQVEDRGMTLTWVPRRRLTPRFTQPAVQPKLHQPQQGLGHHLNLESAQDRLFGPRSAFLHPQSLFMVAKTILLAKSTALLMVAHSLS